jgi:hypothetical protein
VVVVVVEPGVAYVRILMRKAVEKVVVLRAVEEVGVLRVVEVVVRLNHWLRDVMEEGVVVV